MTDIGETLGAQEILDYVLRATQMPARFGSRTEVVSSGYSAAIAPIRETKPAAPASDTIFRKRRRVCVSVIGAPLTPSARVLTRSNDAGRCLWR